MTDFLRGHFGRTEAAGKDLRMILRSQGISVGEALSNWPFRKWAQDKQELRIDLTSEAGRGWNSRLPRTNFHSLRKNFRASLRHISKNLTNSLSVPELALVQKVAEAVVRPFFVHTWI